MSLTYARRAPTGASREREGRAPAGPDIAALSAGAAPTPGQMGSRVDLPEGIREKMESSFGADFSDVKLYESQTVADAGAQAVTQGTNIAFAPGKLDLTSTSGQALLGHELSHVVSQARGESTGRGFLKDASLEAQADRQGAMAARGESAWAGTPGPVSPVSAGAASASAGPMQASKVSNPVMDDDAKEQARKNNDKFAAKIQEAMYAENSKISDATLRNPRFMQFVAQKAGENARDDMATVDPGTTNWDTFSIRGFRGNSPRYRKHGRAFQELHNHMVFRALEGGTGDDGKLRTNLTDQMSSGENQTPEERAITAQNNLKIIRKELNKDENTDIMNMIQTYHDAAFNGGNPETQQFNYEQKSTMVMSNILNSFGAAAFDAGQRDGGLDEGKRRMKPSKLAMSAAKIGSIRHEREGQFTTDGRPIVEGTSTGKGTNEAGIKFLEMLAPISEEEFFGDANRVVDIDELSENLEREGEYNL